MSMYIISRQVKYMAGANVLYILLHILHIIPYECFHLGKKNDLSQNFSRHARFPLGRFYFLRCRNKSIFISCLYFWYSAKHELTWLKTNLILTCHVFSLITRHKFLQWLKLECEYMNSKLRFRSECIY